MERELKAKSNEEKYQDYCKIKIFKIVIVFLALVVIALEILALFNKISMFWGIGLFIVIQIINKIYLK